MEKEILIATIEDEITELKYKKGRNIVWVKQELKLIKDYSDYEDIWSATRTLKAHIEKIEQYKASIMATEARIESLEWALENIKQDN